MKAPVASTQSCWNMTATRNTSVSTLLPMPVRHSATASRIRPTSLTMREIRLARRGPMEEGEIQAKEMRIHLTLDIGHDALADLVHLDAMEVGR